MNRPARGGRGWVAGRCLWWRGQGLSPGDADHGHSGSNIGGHSFKKKRKGNANVLSDISVAILMLLGLNPSNGESDAKSGCDVALTFALFSSRTVTKAHMQPANKITCGGIFHFYIFFKH